MNTEETTSTARAAFVSPGSVLAPLDTEARCEHLAERIRLMAKLCLAMDGFCFFAGNAGASTIARFVREGRESPERVNVLGVLVQSFVVARLLRFLGLRLCFLVFPLIALCDAGAVAIAPALAVITVGKAAENSSDYSLNNTLRQLLWLVTTRDMKYKAKQAVDTFFVRLGDVSSALVWLGAALLLLDVRHFAVINLVLCAAWLSIAVVIGRYREQLRAAQRGSGL